MLDFSNFFNKKTLKKYNSVLAKVNDLYTREYEKLEGESIAAKFQEVKSSGLAQKQKIIHAVALAKVASKKSIGMVYYDEQIIAALALVDGAIAEMRTGEGKTLMCSAAASALVMIGWGVHVATANDYLAQRDSAQMMPIYNTLGLSCMANTSSLNPEQKRQCYECDIIYSTAQEMGFDYLRDNLVIDSSQKVQRKNFNQIAAVIDEADFILIDEARTPLIISGQAMDYGQDFYHNIRAVAMRMKKMASEPIVDKLNPSLNHVPEGDFWIDEKTRSIYLSDEGYSTLAKILFEGGFIKTQSDSEVFSKENLWLLNEITNALRAQWLYIKDKNYAVINQEIVIIDENTGRLSPGRTWSDGLHQAIEAKEAITINPVSSTVGSISIQNYFRKYGKICGMSGTAKHCATEFEQIYSTQVVQIPTHKPMIRVDHSDRVYLRQKEKNEAIVSEIKQRVAKGQCILVGTDSVAQSVTISELLAQSAVEHVVLNAKEHEMEAHIISMSGASGKVTVSTSMAGRGTDIILGGNAQELKRLYKIQIQELQEIIEAAQSNEQIIADKASEQAAREIQAMKSSSEAVNLMIEVQRFISYCASLYQQSDLSGVNLIDISNKATHYKERVAQEIEEVDLKCEENRKIVISAGGLCVIGCTRQESRRIDDQIRGRAGRQGDPGESVFFVSFEDSWLKVFTQNPMWAVMKSQFNPQEPIVSSMVSRMIEKSQKQIEGMFFDNRKNTYQYDSVLDEARREFFNLRDMMLEDKLAVKEIFLRSINFRAQEVSELMQSDFEMREIGWCEQIIEYAKEVENAVGGVSEDKRKLMVEILKFLLKIKEQEAAKMLVLMEMQGWWSVLRSSELIAGQEEKLIELISKRVVDSLGYMDDSFWAWLNTQTLVSLDQAWVEFLRITDEIRGGIHLSSMAQKNPIYEYKKACFDLFSDTLSSISGGIAQDMLSKINIQITSDEDVQNAAGADINSNHEVNSDSAQAVESSGVI